MTEVNCRNCWKCIDELVELGLETGVPQFGGLYWIDHMVVCPECGYKLCPKTRDHRAECSSLKQPEFPNGPYQG